MNDDNLSPAEPDVDGSSRRQFLKLMGGASGAALLGPSGAAAQSQSSTTAAVGESGPYLLQNGHVMTMGPAGDVPGGDILVRDGAIEAVGTEVDPPPEVATIDLEDHLVLPGFVDTHTHLWLTQMRGLFDNTEEGAYFPLVEQFAEGYEPSDMYAGTYLGAIEALAAGITFTTPFCDNARTPPLAEAALRALADAGIRARFLYGGYDAMPPSEPLSLDHIEALDRDWDAWSNDGRLSLGVGWGGPFDSPDEDLAALVRREYERAQALGLPLSVHASGERAGDTIDGLAASGYLGPDVQLVHATDATPEQIETINEAGASVSITPISEHRVGFGLTRLQRFADVDRLSLGVDGNALSGSADLFSAMRLLALTESGASQNELSVDPRQVLRLATIEGARALGMDDQIGSLEQGKRADLIAIDLHSLNLGRFFEADPAPLALYSARPDDIALVMVDGEVQKRDGELVDADPEEALHGAQQSIEAIRERTDAS
jgi:cytosine/adenosine deaminase-related metal-dependent hydrolase